MVKIFRSSFWALLVAILLTGGVVYSFSPLHAGKSPGQDASLFMYIGSGINQGKLLYRDLWDDKPPLVFFLDAVGLKASGGSMWGVWSLDLLAWSLSVVLLFLLLRKELGRAGLLFALVIFLLNLPVVFEAGNMTEEYALPCQLAGLYFFTRIEQGGGSGWRSWRQVWPAFALGVTFAAAFLLKQTTTGVWIALAGYMILSRIIAQKPVKWKAIGWAAAGAAAVAGAVLVYFAAHQALFYLWDAAFRFNYYYARSSLASHAAAVFKLLSGWSLVSSILPLGGLAWLAGLVYLRRVGWGKAPLLLLVSMVDFPIEILMVGISGKNYQHYLVSMLPGLVILNAYLVDFLLQSLKSRLHLLLRAMVFLLLLFLAVFQGVKSVAGLYVKNLPRQTAAALAYINKRASQSDYVMVWGYQPSVIFLAGRPTPTRFIHQIPLYTVGYATPPIFEELLSDLQDRPPKFILDSHDNRMPFVKMQGERCVLPGGDLPQGMPEVLTYICEHYRYDQKVGPIGWAAFTLDTSTGK